MDKEELIHELRLLLATWKDEVDGLRAAGLDQAADAITQNRTDLNRLVKIATRKTRPK